MSRQHRLGSFRRALPMLEYSGDGITVRVPCVMVSDHGSVKFESRLKVYDIWISTDSIEETYKKVCEALDQKLAIEWKPYLMIDFACGVKTDFSVQPDDLNDHNVQIDFKLEVDRFEMGQQQGQTVHRKGGYQIHKGKPSTGRTTDVTHGNLTLRQVASYVDDTPANRAAIKMLGEEFKRIEKHLLEVMKPGNIQKALAQQVRGLLPAAPTERKRIAGKRETDKSK